MSPERAGIFDSQFYPQSPEWSTNNQLAMAFSETFAEHEAVQGHELDLKAIPLTTPKQLAIVQETVSADPRRRNGECKLKNDPILAGIDLDSPDRSSMAMLILGRERESKDKYSLVGIRNLILVNEQDIQESYGFKVDDVGNLSKVGYSDLLPDGSTQALLRGWTFLFPKLHDDHGPKITGTGVGEALGVATNAIANKLSEIGNRDIPVIGEQMGLLPSNIIKELGELIDQGQKPNIRTYQRPLYQILGYGDHVVAVEGVETILAYQGQEDSLGSYNRRQLKSLKKKFECMFGEIPENWSDLLESQYPIAPLFGVGNPNAERMYKDAINMGLEDKQVASGVSCGSVLSGGPVYASPINKIDSFSSRII